MKRENWDDGEPWTAEDEGSFWGDNGKWDTQSDAEDPDDIISEWIEEPAVFRTDGPRADLAVAYPLSSDVIGFTLTVAGKPQQFTMTRSAAASFIGRMAEVLAK